MPTVLIPLLFACAGADTPVDDTATPCTPGYGSVDVCVDIEGGFTVWASDSTLGIETRLSGPGCVTMELPPGRWTFWLDGPACGSTPATDVQECDTIRLDVPVDPFECGVG